MKEDVWIIGAGHFGKTAWSRLSPKDEFSFVMVDPDRESLRDTGAPEDIMIQAEGGRWLSDNLKVNKMPEWIIPALPVHLAAQWIQLQADRKLKHVDVPESVDSSVPNPLRGMSIDLYVSHATFRCPDNCIEPENICTYTGEPRKTNMYNILEEVNIDGYDTVVLKSFQLGPGIGGYHSEQLFQALDAVNNSKKDLLICTACRCHGVISAFHGI